MRSLERNKQRIWYSLYLGKLPILDDDGFDTGDSEIKYSNPLFIDINVSASKGESEIMAFGKSLDYDKSMLTHNMQCPCDEYSVLWIDKEPRVESDGSLSADENGDILTPHDYSVSKKAKSLNSLLYAIKQVPQNRG